MITRLSDRSHDRTFDVLDELRRQMNRVWEDYDVSWGVVPSSSQQLSAASWPRLNVLDAGAELIVTADVPGLGEKDIQLSLEDGVLTLSGERKVASPEGFSALRRERPAFRFTRTVALPGKVDPERATATVEKGVLTVKVAKAAETRPRQIAVRAA